MYEVFEWHPSASGFATNARFKIYHAKGVTIKRVNFTVNGGRWNSLGKYKFNKGTSNYVMVSNDANGDIIADAVKFVYREDRNSIDTIPPKIPKNVRVK